MLRVSDVSGDVMVRFFYFNKSQQKAFREGVKVRLFGQIRQGRYAKEMVHPECQTIDPENPPPLEKTLTSIYPTTEGLSQARLRSLIQQALLISENVDLSQEEELLPKELRKSLDLPNLREAIRVIHHPPKGTELFFTSTRNHPAQKRMIFEELLAHQISLKEKRLDRGKHTAPKCGKLQKDTPLKNRIGFSLTKGQSNAVSEIANDLQSGVPMLRLLQGDVGSGKTVVAAMAASILIEHGFKVVIMAPTELLVDQHHKTFSAWFTDVEVILLTGKLSERERNLAKSKITNKCPSIIIGTHAVFQKDVVYTNLGLIIVDEQHRFGVGQRLALNQKGNSGELKAHQLIMTATPIPRTLAMAAYADLDISTIKDLPPGRSPVTTAVIPEERRKEVITRISSAVTDGAQVYWVCPLIEESDKIDTESALKTASLLAGKIKSVKVGLIHGRMNEIDKEKIMNNFINGHINLLVATTVIEVGVDVPNASLMIIENAERLGLAQLHQLRGRVGRGKKQSSCLLLYKTPLSEMAEKRLRAIRASSNGFEIAERDMELRGPGELLGTRQAGIAQFKIADLTLDGALIELVEKTAESLLQEQPAVAKKIQERWLADRRDYRYV
jgi:ATP-dependent DNA helicase RecG